VSTIHTIEGSGDGAEDTRPSRAETVQLEQELTAEGRVFEFHSYEGDGHRFFAVDRSSHRPETAADAGSGCGRSSAATWPPEGAAMCTSEIERVDVADSGKAAPVGSRSPWPPSTTTTRSTPGRTHPNNDFLDPSRTPSARVAVELYEDAARALATAILDARA
jgi:hypothetical protein